MIKYTIAVAPGVQSDKSPYPFLLGLVKGMARLKDVGWPVLKSLKLRLSETPKRHGVHSVSISARNP